MNTWFTLAVLGLLGVMFVVAFVLMFVFPFGSVAMVFLGIIFVSIVYICRLLTVGLQKHIARRSLERDECPACGGAVQLIPNHDDRLRCAQCGGVYYRNGFEVELPDAQTPSQAATELLEQM